ncbi:MULTISPECIES: acyl-CoA thioesterase [Rhizobium]|uniref:Acyl-CoA thioesterase n=1 Tax=Rhizobium wuzhouense TaxID=1986026 RepID=A0ABX5NNI8_9HYPH|nr:MULTISPECIES: thioesterase family protein [Rhizobium]PYB71841.1 hypothetical protein DMY87_16725 [Rhizobium wuzhouense]RKE79383.1 4-hydroxybenzoyl-CoA thioesterase/acyl-CoA thioester hydrolase [Rhizobium sp. AG855]
MNIITTSTAAQKPEPITRADVPPHLWSAKFVFRHGQCDPAGIVYTPKFFDVFNQAIEAWFCECLGIDYYDILGPRRTGLGYGMAASTFFSPCMMGDEIEVFVTVKRIGAKSYTLVLHALKGDKEALRGEFVTVVTSLATHQSIEIPDDIREALIVYSHTARE